MTAFDRAWDLVKGMDLSGDGGYFRWNIWGWGDLLKLMQFYGWQPQGTIPQQYNEETGEWQPVMGQRRMTYHTNDGYIVDKQDIVGMLRATDSAIEAIENVVAYTPREPEEGVDLMEMLGRWTGMIEEGIQEPDDSVPPQVDQHGTPTILQGWMGEGDLDYLKQWRNYLANSNWFEIG